jgi:hypothetical protein
MGAKALISSAIYGSKIAFQSLGLVTQTTMKRRKAKATFKKVLIQQGVSPEAANEIAKEFPNPVSEIFSIVKSGAVSQQKD